MKKGIIAAIAGVAVAGVAVHAYRKHKGTDTDLVFTHGKDSKDAEKKVDDQNKDKDDAVI